MNGFIKLQRKFYSHWLWAEERSLSKAEAWLDLIQLAAFAPYKRVVQGKLITIDQGQLIASTRYLAARWKWGKDKVTAYIRLLESDSMIRRETRQGETLVILCNYKDYACESECPSDSNKDNDQTGARRETRQRPDSDTDSNQTVTRTKDKKIKKIKKSNNTPLPPEGESPSADVLNLIWSSSPSIARERSSKKQTLEAWKKIRVADRPSETELITALKAWNASNKWQSGYAEGVHLWIKNQKWQDLPEPASAQTETPNSRTIGTHNEGQTFGAGTNPNQIEIIPGLE